ncbi:MAG: hypothetical protein AB7P24_07970 [Nitrospira sp.]
MTQLVHCLAFILLIAGSGFLASLGHTEESKFGTPKGDEGTRIFKATDHPHYSGEFRLKGDRAFLVGSMGDAAPWDRAKSPSRVLGQLMAKGAEHAYKTVLIKL